MFIYSSFISGEIMEENIYITQLFDYYGKLLTDKQKEYFLDYYIENLSLSEIAENYSVSRNAVFKQIKELSGGEKVRVSLCKILYTKPNVLILDEPTNHLDIISKNTIKNMLNSYKGTIIMVSHDRYLIKNITNKLLVFNKNSTELYPFGYEEYLQKRVVEEEAKKLHEELFKKEVYTDIGKTKQINDKLDSINKEINELTSTWESLI